MRKTSEYVLLFLHGLLTVMVLFQTRLEVPVWLMGTGRLHPVLLHLPIGLWAGVLLLYFLRKRLEQYRLLMEVFLHATALLTVTTALLGMFLAANEGYEAVEWHQYAGVLLSFLVWGTALLSSRANSRLLPLGLALCSAVIAVTGHLGGELTHGKGFLRLPLSNPSVDQDNVYLSLVQPILLEKCSSCHNDSKTKGGLNVVSVAHLLQGGKSGPAMVTGNALESHLLKRVFLPLDHKEHMPPKQKPQLTEQEIAILTAWIDAGASEVLRFEDLPADSPLAMYAPSTNEYTFTAASPGQLEAVNSPFCKVTPLAVGSPALSASFYVRSRFDVKQLEKLLQVKDQLVELNLSKMPVSDEDLRILAKFTQLRNLKLSGTDITGSFVEHLKGLPYLKTLSVANTRLQGPEFHQLPALEKIYLWESGLSSSSMEKLKELKPRISIDTGVVARETMAINPPETSEKNAFLVSGTTVALKHALPGVLIKYSTDGTVPDSASGMVYSKPFVVQGRTKIMARAFKAGWLGSEVLELDYLVNGKVPESAALLTAPAKQYAARGAKSLYDRRKGDTNNFLDKTWLGYREGPLEAEFYFSSPQNTKSITISMLEKADSYIMPPEKIQVWGTTSSGREELLATHVPPPLKGFRSGRNVFYDLALPEQQYTRIRLRVQRIASLPDWHPGKGTPGWVFVDEVIFN